MNLTQPTLTFFMYGTLRPTGPLHNWIEDDLVSSQAGAASGRMYSLGDFPCVKFDEPGLVLGDICTVNVTHNIISMVNMELNAGYELVEVPVYRRDKYGAILGSDSAAWAFHFPHTGIKMLHVKCGDWFKFEDDYPYHALEVT